MPTGLNGRIQIKLVRRQLYMTLRRANATLGVVVDSQSSTSLLGGGISGIFGLGTNGGANGSSSSGLSFADSIYSQWLSRNPTRGNFSFGMMLMPPVIEPKAGTQAGTLHWTKPDQSFYHPEKVTVKPIVDTSSNNTDQTDITLNSGQDWTVGLDGWTAAVNNTHLSNTDAVVAVVDPLYPNIYLPGDQAKIICKLPTGFLPHPHGSYPL